MTEFPSMKMPTCLGSVLGETLRTAPLIYKSGGTFRKNPRNPGPSRRSAVTLRLILLSSFFSTPNKLTLFTNIPLLSDRFRLERTVFVRFLKFN
jgi:hypothetical protein